MERETGRQVRYHPEDARAAAFLPGGGHPPPPVAACRSARRPASGTSPGA